MYSYYNLHNSSYIVLQNNSIDMDVTSSSIIIILCSFSHKNSVLYNNGKEYTMQ